MPLRFILEPIIISILNHLTQTQNAQSKHILLWVLNKL